MKGFEGVANNANSSKGIFKHLSCVKKSFLRACALIAISSLSFGTVACNSDTSGGSTSGATTGSNTLTLVSGDKQSGLSGSPLSAPIVAQVLDPNGSPLSGVNVYASVTSGGGSITSQVLSSDANGMVSLGWTLGKPLGVDTLNIILFSDMYSSNPGVTVTASRMAGVAVAGNSSITAVGPLKADGVSTCMITVTLLDSNHQALIGTVPAISASGVNQYTQCTPVNTEGVSTCLMKSTMSGTKTLSITSPINLNGGTVVFNPGVPAKLSITGYVNNLLSVQVEDAFSNPISAQAVDWTVTMGGGSMGGGSSVKTDATGTASNQLEPIASGVQNISVQVHGTSIPAQTFKLDLGVWTFNTAALATTTLGNHIDFNSSNACELTPGNAPDNSAASITAGTSNGITYGTLSDGTSTGFKLGPATSGACDGSQTNCIGEMDSSWAPAYSNLVGYWKLNEASGSTSVIDSSPVANPNGTVYGATMGGVGKINGGANLNGSNSYIDLGHPALPSGRSARTMCVWAKPSALPGGWGWAASYGSPGGDQAMFIGIVGNTVNGGGYGDDITIGNFWQVGVWSHVCLTYDGTTANLYGNGMLIGSAAKNWNLIPSSAFIGKQVNGGEFFPGVVDELAIFNTALTASQVATLYTHQSAAVSGIYTSKVLDSYQTVGNWTSLSWVPTLPFMKALPNSGADESTSSYTSLANSNLMNGNTLLWHFDDAAGSSIIKDSSASGLSNGSPPGGMTLGNAGKLQTSAYYNSSEMDIQDNPSIGLSNTDMTMNLWLKSTSFFQIWKNQHYTLQVSNNITYATSGNWCYGCTGSYGSGFLDGQWHQITIVHNNGVGYHFYKDGVNIGFYPTTANLVDNGSVLQFASSGGSGFVDEFGIWSRALSATEVQQLYQRGASRVKFQVQTCANSNCSDGSWKGPDGTAQTYYSELSNVTSGSENVTSPLLNFSNFSAPSALRYFQYRATFESDSQTTSFMPEVKSITIGPNHYDSTSPAVIGQSGVTASSLTSFIQTLGTHGCSSGSGVTYNLGIGSSSAGATWYYWNSSSNTWMVSSGTTATSSVSTAINANLSSFPASGSTTVYVKAFLNSSGSTPCELQEIQLNGHS